MAALNQEKDRTILFLLTVSAASFQSNKHLEFKNVVIETKMGTIKTDAFDIVNGKLHIGEIYLEEPENGQTIKII